MAAVLQTHCRRIFTLQNSFSRLGSVSTISKSGFTTSDKLADPKKGFAIYTRLPRHLRNRMQDNSIHPDSDSEAVDKRQKRNLARVAKFDHDGSIVNRLEVAKLFGKLNKNQKANVPAGILWPTREELRALKAEQEEWEPSLQTMLDNIKKRKQEEEEDFQIRHEKVEKAMEKMPRLLAQVDRVKNKKYFTRETVAPKQMRYTRKKEGLDNARAYFGFRVPVKDFRFKRYNLMMRDQRKKLKKKMKKKILATQ